MIFECEHMNHEGPTDREDEVYVPVFFNAKNPDGSIRGPEFWCMSCIQRSLKEGPFQ